jgi:predicted O-linked N-acetylglucosamine transferase (SPINDLY family)
LKPDFALAHNNLCNVFRDHGKLELAATCSQRALQLKPDFAEAHNNLGNALRDQGKLEEAMACYQCALQLKPDYAEARSNYLFTTQYRSGVTLSELAVVHAEYDRLHAAPLRTARPLHQIDRDPHRRLRVGFVSPDFGRHPVGYFLIRALENLDAGQIETVCYCDRIIKDDLTRRFQAAATKWRDVSGLSNERLAEQILEDRIDLLFDLAGHTASNRLLVFARKPAPIQITWIGYEGTTGLEAIDYILADRYTISAGQEVWYREQVLRMPDGYVCYDPPRIAPEVGPLPASKNGYLRFGSFNNLAKITSQVVEIWAQVLHRVPGSRLVLKYRGLGDESVCQRYLGLFSAFGVEPSRMQLTPRSTYSEYLSAYGEVDIALDPFPFGGGVTTCDALWMGVPVVTCPGETFASRHCLSHLSSIGLTETIAWTLKEYVELAVSLAGDLPRLANLRAGLRKRMASSSLCDGKRFAANLMQVLRDAWQAWCHKEPGQDSQSES